MGEGNVGIDDYCRKYAELCPGRALSLESIVMGPRIFAYRDPKFWDAYRDIPAWNFERFAEIAEAGKPYAIPAGCSALNILNFMPVFRSYGPRFAKG